MLVVPFLRPLRALRLLRSARLGVVAGVAQSRAQRSLHATVAVYVTTAAAGLLVLAAAAMYDVERRAPSGRRPGRARLPGPRGRRPLPGGGGSGIRRSRPVGPGSLAAMQDQIDDLTAAVDQFDRGVPGLLGAARSPRTGCVSAATCSANIKTFPDALWWAITTVTTVGYGDRYPTTGTGRLVGGALMLVGIALLGVITASIAAWFVDRLRDVQVAETTTEAALGEVLAELKALHTRLDAIERRPRVVEQAKPSSTPAPLPSQGRQR